MALLARKVVLAYLDNEVGGAVRWARHHELEHSWNESSLLFKVRLHGHRSEDGLQETYLLAGIFDDYRALPPLWRFLDPRTDKESGRSAFPAPGAFPGGSVLHSNGIICAPWSRLAFKNADNPEGIHDNWGNLTTWQGLEPTYTQARTIPDMLARIQAEVSLSPHRLAPLPLLDAAPDEEAV